MTATLFLVQTLNGLQLGVLLFLIAAGLTLVFGVTDVVNLAHGVQYMLGAYLAVTITAWTESFVLGLLGAIAGSLALGVLLERSVLGRLIGRSHLDQVLATYGLILLIEEAVRTIWGPAPVSLAPPAALSGTLRLPGGLGYPLYRLFLLIAGLGVAVLLWLVVEHTRTGMRLRAGASNATMLAALGIDTRRLFAGVLAIGAMLAGFAGALAAPIVSVEPGMGSSVLILAFVVIVLGGTGSMRGAFAGALLVGLTDTLGRGLLTDALARVLTASAARQAGPALASMLIYLLMAAVLAVRPRGLFPGPLPAQGA
ncbi:MAG TPA: branched-chain amino acid ABC transporter permease [Acetobacteraceae bacterium]|nr:branched-chain amino acid ABC transporter permease [Acetobacteraceae bacterium]